MDGDDELLSRLILLAVAALDTEPDGVGIVPIAQAAATKVILRRGAAAKPLFELETSSLTFEGTRVNVAQILELPVADGRVRRTPPEIGDPGEDEESAPTYRVTKKFWEEAVKHIR